MKGCGTHALLLWNPVYSNLYRTVDKHPAVYYISYFFPRLACHHKSFNPWHENRFREISQIEEKQKTYRENILMAPYEKEERKGRQLFVYLL
jgi:hypothetical protein